ncbi:MAG: c-type cytochrome [Bryobacterales bacterium]|nr:c-type cytochrome [Bryobacterales bacterium]
MKRFLFAATMTMFALSLPLRAAGDAAKGKEMFAKKCVMCHAADGAGAPAMKKKFGDKLKPLGGAEVQKAKDADLVKTFKEAVNHKLIAKSLADADLDNLIAHIRTLK